MGAPYLLVVALAPAAERYLWLEALSPGGIMRATRTEVTPGGKGVHVALAAQALGARATVVGITGGLTAAAITRGCAQAGLDHRWVPAATETRWCTCLIDTATSTMTEIDEPATGVRSADWQQLSAVVAETLATDRPGAVALSGSFPATLGAEELAALVVLCADAGVPVLLDTSREALRAGLAAGATWVKVNEAEAREVLGEGPARPDPASLCREMRRAGARNAVVTLGARGALACLEDGTRINVPATPVARGFAVGSGDCFLAGLAVGLLEGRTPTDALLLASAAARLNTASPLVAQFQRADVDAEQARARPR
ncbi:MAG: 1-phosphofructokinase family hexose kinase [Propioniciclava sp.]